MPDCTLYRPDDNDPDAEELDLGDGQVTFGAPFEAPREWDAAEREDYFDGLDPALFVTARLDFATPAEPGDMLALTEPNGLVVMYFVHDYREDADGRSYVLVRDEQD